MGDCAQTLAENGATALEGSHLPGHSPHPAVGASDSSRCGNPYIYSIPLGAYAAFVTDLPQKRTIRYKDGTVREVEITPRVREEGPIIDEHKILTSSDRRTQQANKRRTEFVSLLSQGYPFSEAARELGVSTLTVHSWQKRLPSFKLQCNLARQNYYNQISSEDITSWKDFSAFRKKFFRMDTYFPHAQIIDAIESAGPMEIVLILVAPETGKTTLLEDKVCEILARDPDHRIAYISESTGHSRKVGGRTQRRMTDTVEFGDYIARYGPFYQEGQERNGKPWTQEHYIVNKASHDERDYSFEARGSKSKIQGSRVDTLFLDDVQSLDSLDLTAKLLAKFRQEWLTRVGKHGRTIVVGTRVGVGDIYEALIENNLITKLVEIPILDGEGNSVVPELWSNDELAVRRKQVGPDVWSRTYMQDPFTAGSNTFTLEVREACKDLNRVMAKKDNMATIMSLDPGLGGGNSLSIAQYDPTHLELVDQVTDYGLGRTEEILQRVEQFAAQYRPQDFIIEMMAFQQALGKDDRMHRLSEKYGFRIYPHTTGDNKYDPNFGVASMATSMRMREMTIPWGDERSRDTFQPLLDEMEMWRPYIRGVKLRMDRVMSVWFIHLHWTHIRNVIDFSLKKEAIRARALPWRPTKYRRLGT